MNVDARGRRVFASDDVCCDGRFRHEAGDRHDDGGRLLELVEPHIWAPVCPEHDVPMVGRDNSGWLCCGRCGKRATDLVEVD